MRAILGSLLLLGGIAAAYPQGLAAQAAKIPPGLASLKPHEVVEHLLNRKTELGLSDGQVTKLTALHEKVADEPHRFKHDPTKKTHDVSHVPMISRQEAFDQSMAILTADQTSQVAQLFQNAPEGMRAAARIPPGLASLKPHEVVEALLNQKAGLALTDGQVASLTAWHEKVADEPHRFKHDPTKKSHDVTHMPMISRQEAFDQSMAALTAEQQKRVEELFRNPSPKEAMQPDSSKNPLTHKP